MYFHDPSFYDEEKVRGGIREIEGFGVTVKIKTVIVLFNNGDDTIKLTIE